MTTTTTPTTTPTAKAKSATTTKAVAKVESAHAESPRHGAVAADLTDAVNQIQSTTIKSYEDLVGFGQEAISAWVEAGTILSRGIQDISGKTLAMAQSVVEQNVEASKQLLAAKTIRDMVDLQSAHSRAQFDRLVAEGTQISDLSVKLVEESFAPLSQKVNTVIDKIIKKAA
jgi:phasin family protein